jgi:hypothetical protein
MRVTCDLDLGLGVGVAWRGDGDGVVPPSLSVAGDASSSHDPVGFLTVVPLFLSWFSIAAEDALDFIGEIGFFLKFLFRNTLKSSAR